MQPKLKLVRSSSGAQKWRVRALSVASVLAMVLATQDSVWFFGFVGIFGGELVRFTTFSMRLAHFFGSRVAKLMIRRDAAIKAAKQDRITLSADQVDRAAKRHSTSAAIPAKFSATLEARLRAASGGITHIALSDRLLPAPFSAR